jgi:hypothetical protein
MIVFDKAVLQTQLESLTFPHQVAFAALCCERQLPSYAAFAVQTHWGDPIQVHAILAQVWDVSLNRADAVTTAQTLSPTLAALTPDLDDGWPSIFADAALTMIACLEACLRFFHDYDVLRLMWIAESALDAVWQYLHAVGQCLRHQDHPDGDRWTAPWVVDAPLIAQERHQQQADAAALRDATLDLATIARLRRISHACGIQPFVRGLVVSTTLPPEITGMHAA